MKPLYQKSKIVEQAIDEIGKKFLAMDNKKLQTLIDKHIDGEYAKLILATDILEADIQKSEDLGSWSIEENYAFSVDTQVELPQELLTPIISFGAYESQIFGESNLEMKESDVWISEPLNELFSNTFIDGNFISSVMEHWGEESDEFVSLIEYNFNAGDVKAGNYKYGGIEWQLAA